MNEESNTEFKPWGMDTNQFCMLMHLSQFAGYVIPLAGLVLPIVMWATNKDQSPVVDAHGKNILNWMISCIVYVVISCILMLVAVGFIMLIAIAVIAVVFTLIGAIKANDGVVYKYPLSINFIK